MQGIQQLLLLKKVDATSIYEDDSMNTLDEGEVMKVVA